VHTTAIKNQPQENYEVNIHVHYYNYYCYYYYTRLTASFPQRPGYQKGKTSLDLNEARDDGVLGCSGISWTIRKQSAPCSRQITTPTPHHSKVYRPDALSDAQPTASKH